MESLKDYSIYKVNFNNKDRWDDALKEIAKGLKEDIKSSDPKAYNKYYHNENILEGIEDFQGYCFLFMPKWIEERYQAIFKQEFFEEISFDNIDINHKEEFEKFLNKKVAKEGNPQPFLFFNCNIGSSKPYKNTFTAFQNIQNILSFYIDNNIKNINSGEPYVLGINYIFVDNNIYISLKSISENKTYILLKGISSPSLEISGIVNENNPLTLRIQDCNFFNELKIRGCYIDRYDIQNLQTTKLEFIYNTTTKNDSNILNSFQDVIINGGCKILSNKIDSKLEFNKCIFKGDFEIASSNAIFSDCGYPEDSHINILSFSNSTFEKEVKILGDKKGLVFTKKEREVSFTNIFFYNNQFKDNLILQSFPCDNIVSFQGDYFEKNIYISGITAKYLQFNMTSILEKLFLRSNELALDILDGNINNIIISECNNFKHFSTSSVIVELLSITNSSFNANVVLKDSIFNNNHLSNIEFKQVFDISSSTISNMDVFNISSPLWDINNFDKYYKQNNAEIKQEIISKIDSFNKDYSHIVSLRKAIRIYINDNQIEKKDLKSFVENYEDKNIDILKELKKDIITSFESLDKNKNKDYQLQEEINNIIEKRAINLFIELEQEINQNISTLTTITDSDNQDIIDNLNQINLLEPDIINKRVILVNQLKTSVNTHNHKETASKLKNALDIKGNKTEANKFYALEMMFYEKSIKYKENKSLNNDSSINKKEDNSLNKFFNKFVFRISKATSNHGQSILLAFLWMVLFPAYASILVVNTYIFIIGILVLGGVLYTDILNNLIATIKSISKKEINYLAITLVITLISILMLFIYYTYVMIIIYQYLDISSSFILKNITNNYQKIAFVFYGVLNERSLQEGENLFLINIARVMQIFFIYQFIIALKMNTKR